MLWYKQDVTLEEMQTLPVAFSLMEPWSRSGRSVQMWEPSHYWENPGTKESNSVMESAIMARMWGKGQGEKFWVSLCRSSFRVFPPLLPIRRPQKGHLEDLCLELRKRPRNKDSGTGNAYTVYERAWLARGAWVFAAVLKVHWCRCRCGGVGVGWAAAPGGLPDEAFVIAYGQLWKITRAF